MTLATVRHLAARFLPCLLAACTIGTDGRAWAAAAPAGPAAGQDGTRAGLTVWVGGDAMPPQWARQLHDLHKHDGRLVLGLHPDAETVARAREELARLGPYGQVSVDRLPAKPAGLPLIAESVNLLVVAAPAEVAPGEIDRVLAPLGTAMIREGGAWRTMAKPWPDDLGQWTHYLGDATNNAVAQDRRIAPPRHLQFQTGPRWSRHHDHMSSVSALVSAEGRVFGIFDEGRYESPQLPPDWNLVARDAFNGTLLWKRPIARWHSTLWPLKSGPASLPRRLVACGDEVYATLGIDAPVTALDAATGRTRREYAGTAGAEEIVRQGGVLLVLVNRTPDDLEADLAADPEKGGSRDSRTTYSAKMGRIWAGIRSPRWTHSDRAILAFDAASGRQLWKVEGRVLPLTLAADAGHAYYHDNEKVVALRLADGTRRWASEPVPVWQGLHGQGLQSWFAPTLVAYEGMVLVAGGEKTHMSYMGWGSDDIGEDTMTAFSAETGEKLWTADHPYSGYNSPEDLLVARGRVWVGSTGKGGPHGYYAGHDLRTGERREHFPPTLDTYWFHHRCYRAKATENYILSSRTGIEFVDLQTGEWTIHHWVRGACLYGIMPANGLVYAPPHPCACYSEALLKGLVGLAPPTKSRELPEPLPAEKRLERGPAYGAIAADGTVHRGLSPFSRHRGQLAQSATHPRRENGTVPFASSGENSPRRRPVDGYVSGEPSGEHWPTYRADAGRSGAAPAAVPRDLRPLWSTDLGGRLTPPIAAGGRLFVAAPERHAVHALDANSGEPLWTFTAGGRVDSPPTYDRGRLLFGCADGYVYCLRAADGALAWRFLAATTDRRMVAYDQVESCWPVHGSVLVQDGVVHAVAGRSMYLDGGLRLCRLDVETGRLLGEQVFDDRDPQTGENFQQRVRGLNMAVGLPDILSSDGERLYMRSQVMDLEGNRLALGPAGSGHPHLFAPYGFTDDSWFHRTYWVYGDGFQGGIGGFRTGQTVPAGRILAHNDETVFGYGRKTDYWRWSSVLENHLFAAVRPKAQRTEPMAVEFANTDSLDPAGKPLTIAAWVRTAATDGTILVRGANVHGFALVLADRKPQMLLRTKDTTHVAAAGKPIGDGWTHVAGVLGEDGRMTVYVDGQAAGTTDGVPLLGGTPIIPMRVGHDPTNQLLPEPLTPFQGALDEVMLFHRALPAKEVARLADPDAALDAEARKGQVLHLAFTEGALRDRSPAKNHGDGGGTKFQTVPGPVGDALRFEQPDPAVLARRRGAQGKVGHLWSREVPMMVRAMAVAGETLLIAGPPDLLDEVAAFQAFEHPGTQQQLAEQNRALRGEGGALFHAVDTATGDTLAEYPLDAPPVFDGLIAAGGRVFLVTMDGRVLAFAGR